MERSTNPQPDGAPQSCALPMAGIRILDMTSVMLGPYATQMLGDYGADVIKIESPSGDTTRRTGPQPEPGMGAAFIGVNRSKRSIALDLKKAPARETLLTLVERADVLICSIRPQKLDALGLNPGVLHARNPRLIIVSVHGFAQGGPYAGQPAYDDIIQGLCGFAALTEAQTGEPLYFPTVAADKTCALFAAQAILMALVGRARSGKGVHVEVPMFEAMTSFTLAEHLYGAHFAGRDGKYGYDRLMTRARRPYRTADGYVCALPYTDVHWRRFFEEVGDTASLQDPRFRNIAQRTRHIDALYSILGAHLARRPTEEWLAVCRQLDIPAARMNRLEDLESDPQLVAGGFFMRLVDPALGEVKVTRPVLRFDAQTPQPTMPPRLGQHTIEVLREAGLSPLEIEHLLHDGAAM
ncbi:CoA transferase [Verticiella sediminum]|uniref:CoA transferase n=2 Tax=Verticiella sediminum TaxID=1247510 RepID=A0A556AD27_9BURK|nr:CoA transferase [Verticiella sediminum]